MDGLLKFSSPTPKDRGKLIRKSEKQFKKSDESACSIVPSRLSSRLSISTRQTEARVSVGSEKDIIYHRLSFEDELFTARVYKRNYRNSMILGLRKDKPQVALGSKVSSDMQRTNTASSHDESGNRVIDQNQDDEFIGNAKSAMIPPILDKPHVYSIDAKSNGKFISACEQGDCHTVKVLLKSGHNVYSKQLYRDSFVFGAIHAAVIHGHIEVVRLLLQHGASIEDDTTTIGSRPLHLAAQSGNSAMVGFLLSNGAEIDAKNHNRLQPVHIAAKSGKIGTLRVLVNSGAQVDCLDNAGRQPLHWAAESSDWPDVIRFLVDAGADVNARTKLIPINIDHERPLNMACRQDLPGNVGALLILGAAPTDPYGDSWRTRCPLSTAIDYKSPRALEALLDYGAKTPEWLGASGKTPLHLYIENPPLEDIENNAALLALIIRYQDNIDAPDEEGDTALQCIVQQNPQAYTKRIVNILLDGGASPNIFTRYGSTPLARALFRWQDRELFTVLVEYGARDLERMAGHALCLDVQTTDKYPRDGKRLFGLYWRPEPDRFDENYRDLLLIAQSSMHRLGYECSVGTNPSAKIAKSEQTKHPTQDKGETASNYCSHGRDSHRRRRPFPSSFDSVDFKQLCNIDVSNSSSR